MCVTKNQRNFMNAKASEVLFGGAAGGGKSYAQLVDLFWYAMEYAHSKQLVLRRTYPELEKSLIREALGLFPHQMYRYYDTKKMGVFANGAVVYFGYCNAEKDVYKYQSAEYDMIRFDELTHFSESMYLYLMSRLRGANNYPKQMKSCTNPGGLGHAWVKARFIDPAPPSRVFDGSGQRPAKEHAAGTRVFLPAFVQQNPFLMQADPDYPKRLEQLPQKQKQALLYGNWDLFEGQYFDEFARAKHVVKPYEIPPEWRVYRVLDYGLDMLACLWIALKPNGNAVVFKEVYEKNLVIFEAAKAVRKREGEPPVFMTLAPPDLWNRRQETGKSVADIFLENGITLTKSGGARVSGWMAVKEWLLPREDEMGNKEPKLKIFEGCRNLIRTLPALRHDENHPNDVAGMPHELTHAPDALRCFCGYWVQPALPKKSEKRRSEWERDMWEDFG